MLWNGLVVVTKWLSYVGFSLLLGLWFCRSSLASYLAINDRLRPGYSWLALALLLVCAPAWLLASTGAMAESGLAGMLDPIMLQIMLDSSVGAAASWRLIAALGLLACALLALKWPTSRWLSCLEAGLLGLLAYSFAATGHLAEAPLWLPLLVTLHLLCMAWWLGLLPVLWRQCGTVPAAELKQQMVRFGQQALWPVAALFLSGLVMGLQLLEPVQLLTSDYGQVALLKLALVASLLGLAARHRWSLVANLTAAGVGKLRNSIALEMLLAVVLLLVTASLTSLVGPPNM